MILSSRLQVGDLALINPVVGAYIEAAIGAFAARDAALAVRASIEDRVSKNDWLRKILRVSKPDYVAAYATHARDSWATDACDILNALQRQYDARIDDLKRQLEELLDRTKAPIHISNELQRREMLEMVLGDCERELNSL